MVIRLTVTTRPTIDPALTPFINAQDETASDQALQQVLIEEAEPLINSIVRSKLQTSRIYRGPENERGDLDDLCGEVIVRLVKRLLELKANPDRNPVSNLRGYVTTMTQNACDEYLRDKYPERHRLKNRLRYIVTHTNGFALWQAEDRRWVCGFVEWRASGVRPAISGTPDRLLNGVDDFTAQALGGRDAAGTIPGDLIASIFDRIGSPVEFDDLVAVVAQLWGIKDRLWYGEDKSDDTDSFDDSAFDPRPELEAAIDRRRRLQRVWTEICELSSRQRAALLLSLRDQQGRSVLTLLPVAGIATIRQIAGALDLRAEQLLNIWDDLPLEDSKIGRQLGATAQQVVNLRKSARERLARRTQAAQGIKN